MSVRRHCAGAVTGRTDPHRHRAQSKDSWRSRRRRRL